MARHRINVVNIFDVVVVDRRRPGHGLVSGTTLKHWLEARPRSPQAILDAFVQAGRGLAAAHEAGLVHRDFKPTNVLVDDDGRVRVTDFGVARARGDHAPEPVTEDAGPSALDTPLTRAGTAIGTPRYMAPEQRRGASAATSDQFAFCVALFEALYGRHPYGPRKVDGKHPELDIDTPPAIPDDRRVPARVARALLRGLSLDPARRFATMEELLAALSYRARGRAIWLGAGAAAAVMVAGAVVVTARTAAPAPAPCRVTADELAGVWDQDVKRRAEAAFRATQLPYATAAWTTVARELDDVGAAWKTMRRDACEATHVRGTQSGELLDARMVCLFRRRDELEALAHVFVDADATVVERSADAVHDFGDLSACADAVALSARLPLPPDPELRARIAEVTLLAARAKAAAAAGRVEEAIAFAGDAVERATALDYPPVLGAALTVQARVQEAKDAELTLHRALQAAEVGRDDLTKVDAWIQLIYVVGYRLGRPEEGERWATYADAVLGQLGDHPRLHLELLRYQGMMAAITGRLDDAIACYQQALALAERVYGPESYEAASVHAYWAVAYGQVGDLAHASVHDERAVAIYEQVRGPRHPEMAMPLNNMATTLLDLGELDRAREAYDRARVIWEHTPDGGEASLHLALFGLGRISFERGAYDEALAYHQRALDSIERHLGGDHPEAAQIHLASAEALLELGRVAEASDHAERAVAIIETSLGPDHPDLVGALTIVARTELRRGDVAAANTHLARASALSATVEIPLLIRAELELALAQAAEAAGDHRRARALAATARARTATTGKGGERLLVTIDRWLASAAR
ncbi:MAG: tetratricopeptide repeat protein [Kofleriaceae bacterium]|nr:tetratricopeptide repeat protein [Kofleriaceae bacterium]